MIKIKNLHFKYSPKSEREALAGIDLHIPAGESVALMGANGSGKTTIARCLNALLTPGEGEVLINGLDSRQESNHLEIRTAVGMVFQNPENQIVSTTVEREIAFGLENLGIQYEKMHRIVDEMLDMFDLAQYRKHPPHLLSGGEMQRLAIASVVAMSPQFIVFDEPTALLDPPTRETALRIIKELNSGKKARPISVLLITQTPEEALICDRLLVLEHGKLILDGTPHDIFLQADRLAAVGLSAPVEYVAYHKELHSGKKPSFTPQDFHNYLKNIK